jgi:hypothetical protein
MGHLRAAKARLLSGRADLASTVAALENTYENLQALEKARDEAQVNLDVVLQRIKLAQDALAEHSKGLNAIFDLIKPNIEKDSRARVENAMHELYFDATFSTQILKQFVTIPTDVLTLMLVIAMGVLGSSMQVNFATLVKNQTVTISGYVMRLTVGALTALVIFIVAKAGVPVIADTSRFGGDAPINPYLVSFLAIISGLMSENAIASVQAQGTRFFGAGVGGPDRWVRTDMTGDLAREDLSLSAIAGHLDVSEASATAKLKGAEKLNPEQQKALALYLRRDPRDLYTDIAPPESPAE